MNAFTFFTKRVGLFGAVLTLLSPGLGIANDSQTMSLGGQWRFELDRQDAGIAQSWAGRKLPDSVKVPVDLAEQGIGDRPSLDTQWIGGIQNPDWWKNPELAPYSKPDNFKFPYWLTPERRYMGAAWYQRDLVLPQSWEGRRVVLFIERAHWETQAWMDGKPLGTNNALGTPHEYELGMAKPGKHTLTLRVDNRLIVDVGINSHSVSDHTQGDWNGMVGAIELRSTPTVWIGQVDAYPEIQNGRFVLKGEINNVAGKAGEGLLEIEIAGQDGTSVQSAVPVRWGLDGGAFVTALKPAGALKTWDEFAPNLYTITIKLGEHSRTIRTGAREITSLGTQFVLNGHKMFFRGTLECAIFPKTGHPPTDLESWKQILRVARSHGLNMLRFHSWCPPEAAFDTADELGFYYQVESSSWANQSTTLGDGKPVDAWVYQETARILKYYGNHPSLVLMPYGNEPGGKNAGAYLAKWIAHFKQIDQRRLYTSGSGWPQIPENQFHVTPDPRIQLWGDGLKSRINARPPETLTDYRDYISKRQVPVISHEIGQWCVYPNFKEIPKYTGYLKAKNFEIFRDQLDRHHMGDLADLFLKASGKLQTLCYKEDIESALRTPGMGGFQLLDLHDFPGQGTALVGVLDPFWEEKGYVTPAEYSRFCNSIVPLARLPKRVFTANESLTAEVELSNFGAAPLKSAVLEWRVVDAKNQVVQAGKLGPVDVPVDNGVKFGSITADFRAMQTVPSKCRLVVGLAGTPFENDWDIWVYPAQVDTSAPAEVLVATSFNKKVSARLNQGGKVLLLVPPKSVKPDPALGKIALGFSSIFWNTAWTGRQAPHTLGIWCDPGHPVFASFPTEYHSNWQWWYLVHNAGAMILDSLPAEMRPLVGVIDDWTTNRKLGLAFEARIGKGKLLVCSMDLTHGIESDPVQRQFRHSLLSYMAGEKFAPPTSLTREQVEGVIAAKR